MPRHCDGAAPPPHGYAIVGGKKIPVRYAASFMRASVNGGGGGYAIILSDKRLRCDDLYRLPARNPLGDHWALSRSTRRRMASSSRAPHGEMEYPVGTPTPR